MAAHWQKAQEAEPTLTFAPWQETNYPTTTLPAHVAGKAITRQDPALFDTFHLEAMRVFFSLSQNLEDPIVLRQIVKTIGADLARFDEDCADPELTALVWREFMAGVENDRVTAIPTMFIGEQRVIEGTLPIDRYRQVFDAL